MSEGQELYQTTAPYRMTEEELLFAQMRGVMLHIDREMGVWGEDNRLSDGSDALAEFRIHAEQCGYTTLQEQFYQVPDGNKAFIEYWNSFLPDVGGTDYEYCDEPDIDDGFPLSLEYPDEDRLELNSFDSMMYEREY